MITSEQYERWKVLWLEQRADHQMPPTLEQVHKLQELLNLPDSTFATTDEEYGTETKRG